MIIIVGCGGTGSNLAPMLSRMMNYKTFLLIDGDVVEDKNIARQTYQTFDTGMNKARALAKKLNSNFNNSHQYIDRYIESKDDIIDRITDPATRELLQNETIYICGCVDNNASRLILEDTYRFLKNNYSVPVHYIDAGNEDTFGTVLVDVCRSDFMDMAADDHPAHHCGRLIAEGNLQQYQMNLDMALAIAKVVFAIEQGNEFPDCIKINGFNRITE